jgi:hypothetical protein
MKPAEVAFSDLASLVAVIARSQIVVALSAWAAPTLWANAAKSAKSTLPVGYEDADIAVLEWIAAEGRRAGRNLTLM